MAIFFINWLELLCYYLDIFLGVRFKIKNVHQRFDDVYFEILDTTSDTIIISSAIQAYEDSKILNSVCKKDALLIGYYYEIVSNANKTKNINK